VTENNRVAQVVRSYIPLLAAQAFPFQKIVVIIPLGFLFKQVSTFIFLIGFSEKIQEFYEPYFQRENRPKCVKN